MNIGNTVMEHVVMGTMEFAECSSQEQNSNIKNPNSMICSDKFIDAVSSNMGK